MKKKIEDKSIIVDLRKEGLTMKKIADRFNVTISRIQQIIKSLAPELSKRLEKKKEEKKEVSV